MSDNPLGHVNAYLFSHAGRYVLVDCGWDTDDVFETLERGLADLGARLTDIETLVVTHYHHDHYGMAGRLIRATGARLLMHPLDWERVQTQLRDSASEDRQSDRWLLANGLDPDSVADVDDHIALVRSRATLAEPAALLSDGERIAVDMGELEVVWTPGHSPGHVCLLLRAHGLLLTGDHILTPITPHVGAWLPGRGDALGDYLASLHKCDALEAVDALPAHREPFEGVHRRIAELLAHHDERTAQILAALGRGPADAGAVAGRLPWTRRALPLAELGSWHRQFAVAETIAHLINLEATGRVRVMADDGASIRYELVSL